MKVILLRDVAKIGKRFEVKEVPSGHALNFLIPKKLAEPATAEALRRHTVEMKKKSIMSERHETDFKGVLETLLDKTLELRAPANDQGHLFKGIHEVDIVACLASEGLSIEPSQVVLPQPIKEVGKHVITLKSGASTGICTINIMKA